MFNHYINAFKDGLNFEGRSSRSEYWSFVLISFLISFALNIFEGNQNLISGVYGLIALVPSVAIAIRRMHDIGKSGWNILWGILPIVGWIVFLVLAVRVGDSGKNAYGEDPLSAPASSDIPPATTAAQDTATSPNLGESESNKS